MKTIIISLFMAITAIAAHAQQKSFYDFTVKTIDGEDLSLSTFKGKKVLVVNVASKCGFTPQYAKLEELYKKYGKDNFVIIGFPANNFLSQEPGSNEEIKEFCTLNYGVTFPMMAKISVKGKDIAPLYKWLTEKSENGVEDNRIDLEIEHNKPRNLSLVSGLIMFFIFVIRRKSYLSNEPDKL